MSDSSLFVNFPFWWGVIVLVTTPNLSIAFSLLVAQLLQRRDHMKLRGMDCGYSA